jgi:hypothetical protein
MDRTINLSENFFPIEGICSTCGCMLINDSCHYCNPKKQILKTHDKLKQEAIQFLIKKGFARNEIFEEYPCYIGEGHHYRIDIVGIKPSYSIAIECGTTTKEKLVFLITKFKEVIHLPYRY